MTDHPTLRVNGRDYSLADADSRQSLLRWLKAQRLHGTKEGCADGDCGACTVALIADDADANPVYQAVNSCLLPVGQLVGRELLTVEALDRDGALHPVQQALVDCAGSQCGYCTPGFVMSLFAGYYSVETEALADSAIAGNLCRCTGYAPIRRAAAQLRQDQRADDGFRQQLQQRAGSTATEVPTLPDFHCPTTVAEALALKARYPQAAWIAGATDLGVDLSHGRSAAPTFIALDRITELQQLVVEPEQVRIGAGVSLSRIEVELAGQFPALDQMLPWFAARQVRNRATFGGNLGSASPIGDLLPVLLALDAEVLLHGPCGERGLSIADYFVAYRQTLRSLDELIVAVQLPRRAGLLNASFKVAKRQTDDISIVAAVFALAFDEQGRVEHARMAYGGVAATPLRALKAEALLLGQRLDDDTVAAVASALLVEFSPIGDHRASAEYRRQLCASLFRKFVAEQSA